MGFVFPPNRRWVGVLVTTVASIATFGLAAPAAAHVGVDAGGAAQGDAADLAFTISNECAAPLSRVEIQLPADTPIAEVYPLSADNFAPTIVTRPLASPLPGIHGPAVTDTAATITYVAMPGQELPPGGTVTLTLSAGPMPAVGTLYLGVVLTCTDGTVVHWTRQPGTATGEQNAPAVTLAAAVADPATAADSPAQAGPAPQSDKGSGETAWWVFAAFVLIGGVTLFGLARQHRSRAPNTAVDTDQELASDNSSEPAEKDEPVAAGQSAN
jgi:hypothetical protein